MSDGFQYGDIIVLGLIAAFIALRLRSMLGRGGSGEQPREVWKQATRDLVQDKIQPIPERILKKPVSEDDALPSSLQGSPAIAAGLKAIRGADANFSTTDFIAGARLAFEWVVDAFSKGDKDKLRMLLSDERFRHFSDAIDARAQEDVKHETTLVAILATDITEAQLQGSRAQVTMQFTSEQVNVSRDSKGTVVGGDLSAVEKVIDVWTFERDVSSRDPNWKIVHT